MNTLPTGPNKSTLASINKSRGYTLVELLISVTISAMLLSYGFSAYRKAQDKQVVQAAGETITRTLREAQKKAQIGEKDCTGPLVGYYTTLTTIGESRESSTIEVIAQCASESGSPTTTEVSNITFDQTTIIIFKPLNGGLSIIEPTGITSIDITYTSPTGITHSVQIDEPGNIRYEGTGL